MDVLHPLIVNVHVKTNETSEPVPPDRVAETVVGEAGTARRHLRARVRFAIVAA